MFFFTKRPLISYISRGLEVLVIPSISVVPAIKAVESDILTSLPLGEEAYALVNKILELLVVFTLMQNWLFH